MRKTEKGLNLVSRELWSRTLTAFQDERDVEAGTCKGGRQAILLGPSKARDLRTDFSRVGGTSGQPG